MRQIEGAYVVLSVYFLVGSNDWVKSLLEPTLSWKIIFGISVLGSIVFMLHEIYWIHKSISYMIDRRAQNITEIGIEEAESGPGE
jgi:hypothetical protein